MRIKVLKQLGTGFDSTLIPVVYGVGTAVQEAPYYTVVSGSEIWVELPAGISYPVTIDLLRSRGDGTSARITGSPTPPVSMA